MQNSNTVWPMIICLEHCYKMHEYDGYDVTKLSLSHWKKKSIYAHKHLQLTKINIFEKFVRKFIRCGVEKAE